MPSFTIVDTSSLGIWVRSYYRGGWSGINFFEPSRTVEMEHDGPYEVRLQRHTQEDEDAKAAWDPQIIIPGVTDGDVITVSSMDQDGGWTKESPNAVPAEEDQSGSPARWMPADLGSGPQHEGPIFFTSDPTEMLLAEMASRGETVFSDPDWSVGPDRYYWEGDAECVEDYRKDYDKGIVWKRVSQTPGAALFVDEGGKNFQDIVQGRIGDCWLCAVLSSFANVVPFDRLEGLFVAPVTMGGTPMPPVVSETGLYVVRLWIEGAWRYLPIDDQIPFLDDRPIGVHAEDPRELWTMLVEKAFAKWANGYQMLRGGMQNAVTPIGSARALQAVSGAPQASDKEWQKGDTAHATDAMWAELLDVRERSILSTCSDGLGADGIVSGHVFTLLDAREIVLPERADLAEEDTPAHDGGPTRFVVVDDTKGGILVPLLLERRDDVRGQFLRLLLRGGAEGGRILRGSTPVVHEGGREPERTVEPADCRHRRR